MSPSETNLRSRDFVKRRTRAFCAKVTSLSPPGNRVSRAARTHLHFHGARLANAYCIYLLASKVNLPAPVYEPCAHTPHTYACNLAAITGTERERERDACATHLNDCVADATTESERACVGDSRDD